MIKRAIQGALGRAGFVLMRRESYLRLAAIAPADMASIASTTETPQETGSQRRSAKSKAGVRDASARTVSVRNEPSEPLPEMPAIYTPVFDYDGLRTDPSVIHNHDFMRDPRYVRAFHLARQALGHDHLMYWRLHVALWCASVACRLPGDFVECGVWRGFLSTAIMDFVDWPNLGKEFFLFDTFNGLDERFLVESELANRQKLEHFKLFYTDCYDFVCRHFANYERVRIVRGAVPESLGTVAIDSVSFLSIDMNCVEPEIAAADYFWDRLVTGAMILLDDYGFVSYEAQRRGFDRFAARRGVEILALPTGQGLIIKP